MQVFALRSPWSRSPRWWAVSVVLSVLVALTAGLAPASPASGAAATSPGFGQVDPLTGFPAWFEDSAGTRLVQCLQASDPNCVVLADTGFDPAKPVSFPGNFPQESFYSLVDSGRLDTKGCSGTKPGRISVRMALEGAFANGAVKSGDQMTFGRVRLILTGGLCKSSTYTVTYPLGQMTFTTDTSGALARNQGTTDVGCVPVAPNACDWKVTLTAPVLKSFLRWDPAVAPAAPVGYLGDAVTAHRITGATYTAPGQTSPANYFQVAGPSLSAPLRTDLFTVSGKLAGPLAASPGAVDFGGVATGSASATKDVVVTNLDAVSRTPGAATLTGVAGAEFAVVNDGCTGQPLARDASCSLQVRFTPATAGARAATLSLPYSGTGSPLAVALSGTGTVVADTVKASVTPTSVDFGRQRIGTRSQVHPVQISSTGSAPLQLGPVTIGGADKARFSVVDDRCSDQVVASGSTCTVGVVFDPTVIGAMAARVSVPGNDPGGALTVDLAGTGYGGVAGVSPTTDPSYGFPEWYQDENATRLAQCIDPQDPNCIVLTGGTYTGTPPLRFPGNFPDEFFYTVTDSDVVTTPGCQGSAPGKAMIRMAVEGAFANGAPVAGEQMTFGRIRINATGGLCPDTEYTFVHPYGVDRFTTDASGGIKRTAGTEDVGCLGATVASPCGFGDAVRSRLFESFLRWDPATGPAAPAGYLGDGVTLHRITGSAFTPVGETVPANSFRIFQGSTLVAQTSLFTVMGKLAGPLVASPHSVAFPDVEVGTAVSSHETVTLRNEGATDLTINGLALRGTDAGDFSTATADDRCTGAVLAAGATCTVGVGFTPGDVGLRTGQLVVTHTGLNSPMAVDLHGTGTVMSMAALSVTPRSVAFTDLAVGRTSPIQTVTVSNTGGSAPLQLDPPRVTGPDATSFTVVSNGCTAPVASGATCPVTVAFTPDADGVKSGALLLGSANAKPAAVSVALTGTGFGGASAVSTAVRADGFPEWYQDKNGVRVEPCLDAGDPRCVVLAGPGYDPALPLAFPGNYPPEFFYALADSSLVPTPGCDGTAAGTAMLRLALEGSFVSTTAQSGQQTTFGRVRINVTSGLCPSTAYDFTTPYGVIRATTNAEGAIARNAATTNVGCGAAPCDFGAALGSPVAGGLLRWAPGVGLAAPTGYLGDGVSFHQVVGATHQVDGVPANWFSITDATGAEVGRTDRFAVSGKLATGVRGTPVDFADQGVGTTSTRSMTFTNMSRGPATIASVSVSGNQAYTVTAGSCTATLAGSSACTVDVTFAPTSPATADATVSLLSGSGQVLGTGTVTGRGTVAASPRAVIDKAAVAFPDQRVGSLSTSQVVTLSNTGAADLHVGSVDLAGIDRGDFTVAPSPACATLAPGASCSVTLTFAPTAAGNRSGQVEVVSDDPTGTRVVGLTGTGTSAVITLRNPTLDLGKVKAGRSVTKSLSLTNTGTAGLSIGSVVPTASVGFSATLGTCTGVVAAGRTCSISVTFAAAGAAGLRRDTMRFLSDASNAPTLNVTATVT